MNDQMLKVALILGSTRPGRNGEAVSQWVYEIAKRRSDANFELVDIKDFNLPYWMNRSHLRRVSIVKNTPTLDRRKLTLSMHISL
jgi:NADPH-dependent FMN reductase